MNNVKKITAETALEDFKKIMVFNLVNKIQYFYRGDYKAFWNAKDEFVQFRNDCKEYGWQDKTETHRIYNNLEKFDRCGLPFDVVRIIFNGVPGYKKLIEKYLVAPHGTLMTKKKGKKTRMSYGNVYRPETIDELREIFKNEYARLRVQNTKSNYYTKRQKRIIHKYLTKNEKKEVVVKKPNTEKPQPKIPVRAMRYNKETPCPKLPVNTPRPEYEPDFETEPSNEDIDALESELDEFFN